jgi:hypothetical protein
MAEPTEPSPERPSNEGKRPVTARRRLLQGGLSAAPVLMTLLSRPVLGQTCQSPSGFTSANASNVGTTANCTGHLPAFWANPTNFSQWPTGFVPVHVPSGPQETKFGPPNGVFSNAPNSAPFNGQPSLLDALSFTGNATNDVARYVSAAVLNAAKGLTPVLTVQQVKDIWAEYGATGYGGAGYYSPTAGARWFAPEIIAYLLTTMS